MSLTLIQILVIQELYKRLMIKWLISLHPKEKGSGFFTHDVKSQYQIIAGRLSIVMQCAERIFNKIVYPFSKRYTE